MYIDIYFYSFYTLDIYSLIRRYLCNIVLVSFLLLLPDVLKPVGRQNSRKYVIEV